MSSPPTPPGPSDPAPSHREIAAENRHDAFISYSHRSDDDIAPALRAGMQRLAKPWYRRRAMHVFLDRTSMSADPALWLTITRALDSSNGFVLLLSPEAAASTWVNREIEHWLARHGTDRLLPVLTGGELEWDAAQNRFTATSTAAPPALATAFAEEPRYIDLRWADRQPASVLSLRDPRFADAIAEMAAPLRGVPKDELVGADLREHRRTMRIARAAVGALVVLLLASVLAAFVARSNAQRAERRRLDAQAARVRLEASSPRALPDAGFLLAAHAYELRPGPQTADVLIHAAQRAPDLRRYAHVHSAQIVGLAYDETDKTLVSYDKDGGLVATDPATGATRAKARAEANGSGVVTAPGGVLVVGLSTTELREPTTLRVRTTWASGDHPFAGAAVIGTTAVLLRLDGFVTSVDLSGGTRPTLAWQPTELTALYSVSAAPDGTIVLAGVEGGAGAIRRVRFEGNTKPSLIWKRVLKRYPNGIAVSADAKTVAVGQGASVVVLDAATGEPLGGAGLPGTVAALATSSQLPQYALTVLANGDVSYVSLSSGARFNEHMHAGAATAITWSPAGAAASGDSEGAIAILNTGPNRVTGARTVALRGATAIAITPSGRDVYATTSDGTVVRVSAPSDVTAGRFTTDRIASVSDATAIASAGTRVVVGDKKGVIRALMNGKVTASVDTGSRAPVYAIASIGDDIGTLTASGLLQTWRIREGRFVLQRTLSDRASSMSAAIVEGRPRVAFFESSAGVVIADGLSGTEVARYPLSAASAVVALAPDGRRVAISDGADVRLLGEPGTTRALPAGGEIAALAFTDGGAHLLAADPNSGVRLIDVATGASAGFYVDEEPPPTRALASTASSRLAVVASVDAITFMTFDPAAVIRDGCALFDRRLAPAELARYDLASSTDPCAASAIPSQAGAS